MKAALHKLAADVELATRDCWIVQAESFYDARPRPSEGWRCRRREWADTNAPVFSGTRFFIGGGAQTVAVQPRAFPSRAGSRAQRTISVDKRTIVLYTGATIPLRRSP